MINLYSLNLNYFNIEQIVLLPHIEEKYQTFKSKKRQIEYVASQWLRHYVFSKTLGVDQEQLSFLKDQNNRPFLANDRSYDFNITHSGHWLIMVVTNKGHIGIDLESLIRKHTYLAIAEQFFSDEEFYFLKALKKTEQLTYFYLIWTLKEARLKCTGQGIANGLKQVNYIFDDDKIIPLERQTSYQYISFMLDDQHIGSICLKSDLSLKPQMINCYQVQKGSKLVAFDLDMIKRS
ncbi:4'-phosphopantetheinyl transferase superfamily protein [Thiotrichales bacterium 19X7-9]|nr:4'-phosphopantetheinyl transferase superfamily protein [Thiotrichales bacterium 19X7-9]